MNSPSKTIFTILVFLGIVTISAYLGSCYNDYAREKRYESIRATDLRKYRLHGMQTLAYQAIKDLADETTAFEQKVGFPARQLDVFDSVNPSAELLLERYSHASNWEENYTELRSTAEASLVRLKFFSLALEGTQAESANEARTRMHTMTSSRERELLLTAVTETNRLRSTFKSLARKFEEAQYWDIPEHLRNAPLPTK